MLKVSKSSHGSLRSFRLVCKSEAIALVEALLRVEGYDFEPEPFSSFCRILTHEPKPLGSSLAAFFGYIYIQDRSSMLPPLALISSENTQDMYNNDVAVLDMCASPGSKTGFLAQMLMNYGRGSFVLANELVKPRLATLRANMQNLGFLHVGTCSFAAQDLPLQSGILDYIQLDPPCSGWGTVEKNPKVLELWQGDKIKPLIVLQRLLLQKAFELLRPGGCVVYSTCTTNVDENEEQVNYAINELGFELIKLQGFEGFVWEQSSIDGTLRVDGQKSNAQGFYIAKLQKPKNCVANNANMDFIIPEKTPLYEKLYTQILNIDHQISQGQIPCANVEFLPKGIVVDFNGTARCIPNQALNLLPAHMPWQASPLGKVLGNEVRLSSRCKTLMPLLSCDNSENMSGILILEDIIQIKALLQGQSLQTEFKDKNIRDIALYFGHSLGALPLGRLGLKKGRCFWVNK